MPNPPESENNLYLYQEEHIVRTGLLGYYDPLLYSDLYDSSLSALNIVDSTLPSADSVTVLSTISAINFAEFDLNIEYSIDYYQRLISMFGTSLIAYWPLWEVSGNVANDVSGNNRNGTYSGVQLGQTGIFDGRGYATFGTGDYCNIYSSSLNTVFNGSEGSINIWYKVSGSSIWTSASNQTLTYIKGSGNNYLRFYHPASNDYFMLSIYANNGVFRSGYVFCKSLDWFNLIVSWSASGSYVKYFVNGYNDFTISGSNVWSGSPLSSTECTLGSLNTAGAFSWDGGMSNVYILDRAITNEEALNSYQFGITDSITLSIIGDSIPISANAASNWPYMVRDSYNSGKVILKNHAVSGTSIVSGMDAQVIASGSDNANIIICQAGTNDDNAGNMITLQAEVEENLLELRSLNPNANIYYMNVLPRWTDVTGATPVDKSNIRTAISLACSARGIVCWDTYTDPWINASDTSDGLHPNITGDEKIFTRVLSLLT